MPLKPPGEGPAYPLYFCLVATQLQSLFPFSCCYYPSVCLSPSLYKDTKQINQIGIGAHTTLVWPHLESEKSKSLSHVQLFATPWTIQSMEFSRPVYWSRQPFPSPGDLPNPEIKLVSPALQVDSLPNELSGKPQGLTLTQPNTFATT